MIHIGQQVLHLALFKVFFPSLSRTLLQVLLGVSFQARNCLSLNGLCLSINYFFLPLSTFLCVFPVIFFYSSPSASESGGVTAEIETETENRSNEDDVQATKDDVQAMVKSDIVGKSLAPNVFSSHNFFPRCRTTRVVNLSSVRIKQLDNTFSESPLPWFSNDKLLKLLHVLSFYWNRDLEANTDTITYPKQWINKLMLIDRMHMFYSM